jgi:cob(I)alamin adenosyltransferase
VPIRTDCLEAPIIEGRRRVAGAFEMTVNLTRIYTKLGDGGETHLGDMSRVSKLHPRVEAYGTVDELNATIGVALLAPGMPPRFGEWLARVQNDLLDVGADLAVPPAADDGEQPADGVHAARERLRVGPDYTAWLEDACDEVNATLEPLRSFVIPGGTPAAAHLHVCRTVCRRAERRAIAVGEEGNAEVVRYLNRLSDLLFILSRAANNESDGGEHSEPLWAPGAHSASGERTAS